MLHQVLSNACLAAAILGCIYLLMSAILVRRFAAQGTRSASRPVPVSILKPLHGVELRLFELLASFCRQNYSAPIEIICGVADRDNPAAAVMERLAQSYPACKIRCSVSIGSHGSNGKVSNLIGLSKLAAHDVLVISDCDIEVGPDYLSRVIGELERPGVGAVSCLYHGIGGEGLWSRLSALAINLHFLPSVVVAITYGLAEPCFGSTIALKRKTLDDIGGLESFADFLADDYAIGAAVRERGLKVAIPAFTIGHHCYERSLRDLFLHEVRWARTVRIIDPIGYAGAFVAHPLPLAMIGLFSDASAALMLITAAIICRLVLCFSVQRAFGLPRQRYWLLPVRDLLSFAVFVWGCFGATVRWKGTEYQVRSDGTLIPNRSGTE